MLLLKNYQKGSFIEIKKEFNIANREWLIWKPLLSIAKQIDESYRLELGKGKDELPNLKKEDSVYWRLGQFAESLYEDQSMEKIDDESWEYKTLTTLIELATDTENFMPLRHIREQTGTKFSDLDKKPSSKWMGRYFKRIGLDKKKRTGSGMEYLLSKKLIDNVLAHLDLTTLTTQTTQNTQNTLVEEEQIEGEIENTWIPCSVCGQTNEPCNFLAKTTGKPTCKSCNEGLNAL